MESAKECVTTHLPNQSALKKDGVGARSLYSAKSCKVPVLVLDDLCYQFLSRKVQRWRRIVRVICHEAASGTDLGGSSKHSSGILEDRSGKGFHVNSIWTWVSRP